MRWNGYQKSRLRRHLVGLRTSSCASCRLRSVSSPCPAAKRCDPCCCCYPDTCPSPEPPGCNGNKSGNASSPITNGSGQQQQQQQQQQPFNSPSTLPVPNYPQSSDRSTSPLCPGGSKSVLGSNQQLTDTAAATQCASDSKTLLWVYIIIHRFHFSKVNTEQ